ncbi:hypothetical protein [Pseudomonas moraviensis]|uniref:Uncharacterized protein n=1 Tax=Pseudomonas moraviensis TaxID=321662 RepID=A0A7Y9VSR4_9PSED|nr:hypothetical protein [Pseudomonas moraviensis]NYH07871.1 hypothetical protein [Pseudomonas moraviensis]
MRNAIPAHPPILEIIPSDENFAEDYLQKLVKQCALVEHLDAIHVGIADADAGKLIDLATVKAKWLSR